jgi:hypothetical protein
VCYCPTRCGISSHAAARSDAAAERWTAARPGSRLSHRHPVRAAQRHSVADVATGTGLRIGDDVLATLARLATRRHLDLLHFALLNWLARDGDIDWSRAVVDSCSVRAVCGGTQTGPNPIDRRQEKEQTASDL